MHLLNELPYQIPIHKYFSTTLIPQMFENCKETIQRIIRCQNSIALTTDIWSSHGHDLVFSFTAHFIAEDGFSGNHCLLQAGNLMKDTLLTTMFQYLLILFHIGVFSLR